MTEIDVQEKKKTVPWQPVVVATDVSDSDILTEDEQNLLIYWRDMFKAGQFNIGDLAARKIKEHTERGTVVTHKKIFESIGRYCGKSGRTVRYYYETAIFFSVETRDEFDALPFSHFVLARTIGNAWRDVLEHSAKNPGITEKVLRRRFTNPTYEDVVAVTDDPQWHELPPESCEVSQDILPEGS